jgi:glycine oxidase
VGTGRDADVRRGHDPVHRWPSADDVLVVGGGVVGLAVTLRLAEAGHRVRLVERSRPGTGASTVAAGILSPTDVAEWHGPLGAITARAMRAWPAYAEHVAVAAGSAVRLRACGSLRLDPGDDPSAAWLDGTAAAMGELGVPFERLDEEGCRQLVPGLAEVRGGLLAPTDGAVDTEHLVADLVVAVEAAGATIELDEVVGLLRDGDRVTGVDLARGGRRSAGHAVVATGAWSGAAPWLPSSCRPDVVPVAGEAVLADGADELIDLVVRTQRGSMAPRDGGRLWLGTSVRHAGFVRRPNLGEVAALLDRLLAILPGLAALDVHDVRVGLRPVSADGLPHVGGTPLPGLVLATGHGREGILHAPLVAEAVRSVVEGGTLPGWAACLAPRVGS